MFLSVLCRRWSWLLPFLPHSILAVPGQADGGVAIFCAAGLCSGRERACPVSQPVSGGTEIPTQPWQVHCPLCAGELGAICRPEDAAPFGEWYFLQNGGLLVGLSQLTSIFVVSLYPFICGGGFVPSRVPACQRLTQVMPMWSLLMVLR